jgi:mycofactocin precursor
LIPLSADVTLRIFGTPCRKCRNKFIGGGVTMGENSGGWVGTEGRHGSAVLEETAVDAANEAAEEAADEALLENLLVEEVSIDGMCGVY